MSRLFFMTFHGKKRWTDDVHPHESPLTMTVPMMVLAVGSALLGLVLGPTGSSSDWLEPVVGEDAEGSTRSSPAVVAHDADPAAGVGGAALAWVRYGATRCRTAPARLAATQAARRDLYQDDVNEGCSCGPAST